MSRAARARLVALAQVLLLAHTLALGCARAPAGPSPVKPHPTSVAQTDTLRKTGASWTNEEVRVYYNQLVATIGPGSEQWKREGLSAEERARRAYAIRHDARLTCRAMMTDPHEVEDLRRRDVEKYGNPDGPTFDQLVESGRKKGATGDAIYEGIIASAQRTDEKANTAFGIKRTP